MVFLVMLTCIIVFLNFSVNKKKGNSLDTTTCDLHFMDSVVNLNSGFLN